METIFMNTENSKTNEPHKIRLSLSDKLNLNNPNKNIALDGKTLNQHTAIINLKFLLRLGMILCICLMVLILLLIFRTILS